MKIVALTAICFFILNFCSAQNKSAAGKNAISLEVGKLGLIYNLTFDHQVAGQRFGYRIFAGSNFEKYLNANNAGAGAYYLVGGGSDFLETGIDLSYLSVEQNSDDQVGVPLFFADDPIKTYYATVNIGYRRSGNKTLFRTGFSPGFTKKGFVPGGYISFGIAF